MRVSAEFANSVTAGWIVRVDIEADGVMFDYCVKAPGNFSDMSADVKSAVLMAEIGSALRKFLFRSM